MRYCPFFGRVESDCERPAKPDCSECHIVGGDVGSDSLVTLRSLDELVENVLRGLAPLGPLHVIEEGMQDVDNPESDVDRDVEVAAQRGNAIRLMESGFARSDGPIEHVERDASKKVLLVREMPVEGGDSDSGSPRHGVA